MSKPQKEKDVTERLAELSLDTIIEAQTRALRAEARNKQLEELLREVQQEVAKSTDNRFIRLRQISQRITSILAENKKEKA